MFGRRTRKIQEDLEQVVRELGELRRRTEMMEMVFVVKEPDTVRAAEAYDGLRRQVIASNTERRAHLAQVVEMAVAVRRASSLDDVAARVGEWATQAGIVEVSGIPADGRLRFEDLFDVAAGPGNPVVAEPAFVDSNTGSLIRRGRVVHVVTADRPAPAPAADRAEGTATGPDGNSDEPLPPDEDGGRHAADGDPLPAGSSSNEGTE